MAENNAIVEGKEFNCTPKSLLASNPCLACLSEKELLAALVAIFASTDENYATNLKLLMQDSACFTCMSKKQMLQALITVMGSKLLGQRTVAQVIAQYKCLVCSNEKTLQAALLYMLCHYMNEVVIVSE